MAQRVLRLPENTKGRDFVVGDIHGAFDMLEKALEEAKFDPVKDRLISVGDLVDRGHFSHRVLEFLNKPWFFAVKGNHEDIFEAICRDGKVDRNYARANIPNGMGWILEEDPALLQEIRKAFERLPVAMEVETPRGKVGFVHADVPEGMDWQTFTRKLESGDSKTVNIALWSRRRVDKENDAGIEGIDRVFMGHTPQESGALQLGNCFFVDTGACHRQLEGKSVPEYYMMISNIVSDSSALSAKFNSVAKDTHVVDKVSAPRKPFSQKRVP